MCGALKISQWARLNYTTTHHHPSPPTTIHQRPSPPTTSHNISITTHHHPPPAKIYSPLPTTTQKMDHNPAKAKIYSYITSFWQLPFLRNTIFLYVTEILCAKVLISLFFKFKVSTTFYDFQNLYFRSLRLQDLFLFVFIYKIVMLT